MKKLTITITGEQGAGKTCLGSKVAKFLTREGHTVTCADEGRANLWEPEYAARCTEPRDIEIRTLITDNK